MLNPNLNLNPKLFDTEVELKSMRNGFGEGMILAGEKFPNVVALTADLKNSTKLTEFAKKYPQRFFELGVAEQNLVTVAAGMAAVGRIPFITSYAVFSPGRNWEQIRTTVCLNNLPVKIIGSHAGLTVGPDGASHQGLEDIALMRVLPNMEVICPADAWQAEKAVLEIAASGKPGYLRLSRNNVPVITTAKTPFKIGKADVLWEGKSLPALTCRQAGGRQVATIIACGQMVRLALLAARQLEENTISVRVINCHTIKPLDTKVILKAAEETGAIVTVEEHQVNGGLGGVVAELVSQEYPVPIKIIGVQNSFGETGQDQELLEKYGLTVENIIKGVITVLRMKGR